MENHGLVQAMEKEMWFWNLSQDQNLIMSMCVVLLNVKNNLVAVSLLVKRGFKIVIEFDKFVIPKIGLFVWKGYTFNDMFKLSINEI